MAKDRSSDTQSRRVRDAYNQNTMQGGIKIPSGIYRGIVVNNSDPGKKGRIRVQIMKFYGTARIDVDGSTAGVNSNGDEWVGAMWCRQMLPSGGTTQPSGEAGAEGQSTYGAFGSPPSKGNEVLVAFGGDTHSGIIIGVLPDIERSNGIAGAGVTGLTNTGETTIAQETPNIADSTTATASPHPQAQALVTQGIQNDLIRGQNTSSPNRDASSRVGGMSSPVGHSLVMDDGSVEDGSGLRMRMRTAGGAQILMDDTNGLTYINNREGNVWIELNRNGDMDIYSGGSINYHTEGDFNLHCGGNFNVQAGRDINMKALGAQGIKLEASGGSFNMKCAANMNLQADANGNIRVAGNYRETAGRIDMNGPAAAAAATPSIKQHAGNTNITESISGRVPEHEPWSGHLDIATQTAQTGGNDSNYYGAATDSTTGNDQTGQAGDNSVSVPNDNTDGALGLYANVVLPGNSNLEFAPGIDTRLNPTLIVMMEELARQIGKPLYINSGGRNAERNSQAGGAKGSMHLQGRAVDVSGVGFTRTERLNMIAMASKIGLRGIGLYDSGNMHFDNRTSGRTGWGNDFTRSSVPGYAVSTMNRHRSGGYA
jgi:hypothetical protein